jgi:hypothetical protein
MTKTQKARAWSKFEAEVEKAVLEALSEGAGNRALRARSCAKRIVRAANALPGVERGSEVRKPLIIAAAGRGLMVIPPEPVAAREDESDDPTAAAARRIWGGASRHRRIF